MGDERPTTISREAFIGEFVRRYRRQIKPAILDGELNLARLGITESSNRHFIFFLEYDPGDGGRPEFYYRLALAALQNLGKQSLEDGKKGDRPLQNVDSYVGKIEKLLGGNPDFKAQTRGVE